MKKILELLQNKMNEEFISLNKDDEVLEFLKDFFNEYSKINISTLLEADKPKILTTIVITQNKNIDVKKIYNYFEKKQDYLDELHDFDSTLNIKEIIKKYNQSKIDGNIKELDYDEEFIEICSYLLSHDPNLISLKTNTYINEANLKLKDCYETFNLTNNIIYGKMKVNEKDTKKFGYKYIKENYNSEEYLNYLSEARQYYEIKIKDDEKARKDHNKLMKSYKSLYSNINNTYMKKEVIKYTDDFFGSITDQTFRMNVLKEIYNYNKEIYEKINSKYNKIIANSLLNFKELLLKYGIVFNDYQLNKLTTKDISVVKEMLEILNNKNFTSTEILSEIILISDLETVKNYIYLLESGIISKELLINNIDLFNTKSIYYINFYKNLEYMEQKRINPYSFQSSQHIFLLDSNTFRNNINILESYNLLNNINEEDYYTFLNNCNLESSIDILLELGLEEYLENDLSILNYSDKFNRLRLLKSLGITISKKEELDKYLNDNKFFVPDSKLDEYIYNSVDYITNINNYNLNDIEYYITPRTYKVGSLIFSKNRVQRNLSQQNKDLPEKQKLVYAFLDGAFLTDDELEEFKEYIIKTKSKTLKEKSPFLLKQ